MFGTARALEAGASLPLNVESLTSLQTLPPPFSNNWKNAMTFWIQLLRQLWRQKSGSVFVEYLLLITLVGIGVICGLAAVRTALISELIDLAKAITAIKCP